MARFFRFVFLFQTIFLSLSAFGQNNEPKLTFDFNHLKFEQVVTEIESATLYRFYFDEALTDGLEVTIQVKEKTLPEILQLIFKNTAIKFAIDDQSRVFITRGQALSLNLPGDFFDTSSSGTDKNELVPIAGNPAIKRSKSTAEIKLYEIGNKGKAGSNAYATLSGYIKNANTGERIQGTSVYTENPSVVTASNHNGFYSLKLPVGRNELKIKAGGLKNTKRQIIIYSDGRLDIELEDEVTSLKEVIVRADRDKNVKGVQMGVEKLDVKTIKQIPTAFGESDILRVVLTLPGVKSVGEGSTGMNVRGGAADQNLVLFNGSAVYNPSHLFGFFSAFNPDIMKTVELYKSSVPAKYGGRLSSVLEVDSRDGNKKKFSGMGGIGLLTSRLTLEGPIKKDRTSFLINGRSTYSDWLLKIVPDATFKKSAASFYDVNAQINHDINEKNTLYMNAYLSHDRFRLGADTTYSYANKNGILKWKHIFNNKLSGVFSGGFTNYSYNVADDDNPVTASRLKYTINQNNFSANFNYFPNTKHTVEFGLSGIFYNISPGSRKPLGDASLIATDILQKERALESAMFVSDQITISPHFTVYLGLRYSLYNALGPKDVYQYLPGASKTVSTITDTLKYSNGDILKTYHGPEYRFSANYTLSPSSSVKVSYNRQRQYIHMLSNTVTMSPTDIWKLSDSHIRPQLGDQISLGYYHNFKSNTIEASVEGYYKKMKDFVDYKNGAVLILNHHIETDIINAEGKAYGVEFLIKKLTGKLNGWLGYTYSRSLVRVNAETASDIINEGQFYPSNFDKPHDLTLISNYRFNQRFSVSFNFTYTTGRPITLPLAKYYVNNSIRILYSNRNEYRVPDYYRADIALNLEGNHKVKKLAHSSWTLAVYNLTGRKNPFSVFYKTEEGRINGYQLTIFGKPIPTLTYNFKF
ncbi:TonB-dependent receptor [Rubrolithibacter danxiaensis]|uniref:TonB-dependent receptor n=1 Tax=Rubrolithibacter danxiaensis TaxID=3390805 RepID=UPI003BF7B05C